MGEDADLMLESLKTSLAAVFVSSQRYITGSFDRDSTLEELVAGAVAAEQEKDLTGIRSAQPGGGQSDRGRGSPRNRRYALLHDGRAYGRN